MNSTEQKQSKDKGFTLIELSIVLVIIGLIVGGVLVGQDLIKAAELRATVSQLEKYNTAVNTFRLKYNGIPGDLASPTTFFSGVTAAGTNGCGDGDGLVEDVSACGTVGAAELLVAGEVIIFWYELAQAGLIADNMTSASAAAYTLTLSNTVIPDSKAGSGRVAVGSRGGRNYFLIGSTTGAATAGDIAWDQALTPNESYQLDTKVDDGVANTGVMIATDTDVPVPGTVGADGCHVAGVYALSTGLANQIDCTVSIRTSF